MAQMQTASEYLRQSRREAAIAPALADAIVRTCLYTNGHVDMEMYVPVSVPAKYHDALARAGLQMALCVLLKNTSIKLSVQQRHNIMEKIRYMSGERGR